MYEPGKVLIVGGSHCGWYDGSCDPSSKQTTATAEIIDLNATNPPPTWSYTDPMFTGGRKLHVATLLASGSFWSVGGPEDWKVQTATLAT